jgi:hypothetical protein
MGPGLGPGLSAIPRLDSRDGKMVGIGRMVGIGWLDGWVVGGSPWRRPSPGRARAPELIGMRVRIGICPGIKKAGNAAGVSFTAGLDRLVCDCT